MERVTASDIRRMTETEGLILQGCGGNPNEWLSGINELLTKEGILRDGDTFKDALPRCSRTRHQRLTLPNW